MTTDIIGSSTGDVAVAWSDRDVMLYALGVGAGLGAPDEDLQFTTENSGGIALQAIPSYVSVLAMAARPPALAALDSGRFLHAEQRIDLTGQLPASGQGVICNTVERVLDKGTGAIIVNRATLRLPDDDRMLAEVRSSIFVRGAGGFDGPRGDFDDWALPDRPADVRIAQPTHVELPLLYRLSGDRHRLHSDPAFARAWGFDRPILHGLCTYGIACRALVNAIAGGNPARLLGMHGRFRKPAMPGDTLTTEIWRIDAAKAHFRTVDSDDVIVIDRGTVTIAPE